MALATGVVTEDILAEVIEEIGDGGEEKLGGLLKALHQITALVWVFGDPPKAFRRLAN